MVTIKLSCSICVCSLEHVIFFTYAVAVFWYWTIMFFTILLA